MKEIWYDIPGFSGYQLSSFLRVRSIDRVIKTKRGDVKRKGKILFTSINENGYHVSSFANKTVFIHKLVALVHIPNPMNKKEVNHIDGDKNNNQISNLEWVTREENIAHAFTNKLIVPAVGQNQSNTVLTDEQVIYIFKSEKGARELAREMRIKSHTTISSIRLGKTWNHITGLPRHDKHKRKFQ